MRKLILIMSAIALFFSMTTIAFAESFNLKTDKKTAGVGEDITINIILDEAISGEFRNVQGQLSYDSQLVTYQSHEMGYAYENYTSNNISDREYFTFTNTDFSDTGFTEISSGNIATVKFKTNDEVSEDHLTAVFSLVMSIQDTKGHMEDVSSSISVLICKENKKTDTDTIAENTEGKKHKKSMQICENCGEEYDAKEVEGKITDKMMEQNLSASLDENPSNEMMSIKIVTVVIALAAAAAGIIIYRKMKKS